MSNMHYRLAVDMERTWQDVLAWRIHSFFVERVTWTIIQDTPPQPSSIIFALNSYLGAARDLCCRMNPPHSLFSTSMYFLDAMEQAL